MNRMEPKPVRQPRMNPLDSATTPRENSNNASAMPRRGYLMTARGSALRFIHIFSLLTGHSIFSLLMMPVHDG